MRNLYTLNLVYFILFVIDFILWEVIEMMRKLYILLFSAVLPIFAEETYEFSGKHFLASYLDCDLEALSNLEELQLAMDKAVGSCGATILNQNAHVFPPHGLTMVYLLSESHASIHTYPEFGACFVDLFTCGQHCSAEKFDKALREYLKPKTVNARYFARNDAIEEIPDYSLETQPPNGAVVFSNH